MADTAIWDFTDGATAVATDRIGAARSPGGAGDDRYLTPAYIKDYILGLPNTFTRGQTITQGTANEAVLTSTGYSLTGANAQSMLTFAGTLNTTGSPDVWKLAITDTARGASTKIVHIYAGAAGASSIFSLDRQGSVQIDAGDISSSSARYKIFDARGFGNSDAASSAGCAIFNNSGVRTWATQASDVGWSTTSTRFIGFSNDTSASATADVKLYRGGAANVLALANSTNAQTFYVYNTVDTPTGPTNYQRLALKTDADDVILAAETGGTGADDINITLTPAGTGVVRSGAGIRSLSATAGIGYATGAGGTVTQATSRSTGVTLDTVTGQITTTADSLAALTIVKFTVTNSAVAATDNVIPTKVSGDADTSCWIESPAAGSFVVALRNNDAVAADTTAFVLNFAVIKGVTA